MLRFLFALMFALPVPARADEIVVFAASSMKTALDEVAQEFEALSGDAVLISYAGSSVLANQILRGAPADIFISANPGWMDVIEDGGLIGAGARRDLVGNRLVLAAPAGTPPVDLAPGVDLAGLLGDGWLAMALVEAVPVGQYGKAALVSLGVWDAVAPKVAQSDNARAALALVSTGEAPYGIVYATDAAADEGVEIVGMFAADSHPAIIYPAALLSDSAPARALYAALFSDDAQAVFMRHGFGVLD